LFSFISFCLYIAIIFQDDSGAQITIDKPPTNIVPANRVITIKGAPGNAEKARHLVTKALNTPSLTNQEIITQQATNTRITPPFEDMTNNQDSMQPSSVKENPILNNKKKIKPLPSSEVRPLISYSKVAKASTTLDELEKEMETKCQVQFFYAYLSFFSLSFLLEYMN